MVAAAEKRICDVCGAEGDGQTCGECGIGRLRPEGR